MHISASFLVLITLLFGLCAQAQDLKITKMITPGLYPPLAKMANISGKVEVSIEIGLDGKVISLLGSKLLSGSPQITKNAEFYAMQWEFAQGSPGKYSIIFEYRLVRNSPISKDNNIKNYAKTEIVLPNHILISDVYEPPQIETGRRITYDQATWRKVQKEIAEYKKFSAKNAGQALLGRIIKDHALHDHNKKCLSTELASEEQGYFYFEVYCNGTCSGNHSEPRILNHFMVRRPVNSTVWWDPSNTRSLAKDPSIARSLLK